MISIIHYECITNVKIISLPLKIWPQCSGKTISMGKYCIVYHCENGRMFPKPGENRKYLIHLLFCFHSMWGSLTLYKLHSSVVDVLTCVGSNAP